MKFRRSVYADMHARMIMIFAFILKRQVKEFLLYIRTYLSTYWYTVSEFRDCRKNNHSSLLCEYTSFYLKVEDRWKKLGQRIDENITELTLFILTIQFFTAILVFFSMWFAGCVEFGFWFYSVSLVTSTEAVCYLTTWMHQSINFCAESPWGVVMTSALWMSGSNVTITQSHQCIAWDQ